MPESENQHASQSSFQNAAYSPDRTHSERHRLTVAGMSDSPAEHQSSVNREKQVADVHGLALILARLDSGLRGRGDVDAEDVAQDVAFQFAGMEPKPLAWKGWTATATRHRLIDLARQRAPIPVGDDALFRRIKCGPGPSAGVLARRQWKEVLDVLGPAERRVLNDHLSGATNPELAERYGYASAEVVASTVHRVKRKLRSRFPDLHFDLEPQRVYPTEARHARSTTGSNG